ncbi:probable E3 ubiquitin-protein ligase TRIML1 [Trichosurus vulpecula]|uniref:probable E3 ubiquitin-protein ligase TRIML1 n=1 Tax=Trichosurus vulpecula TaxID=9337 RepID=UPI00186AF293|nr:probable E3 ubiquitin-protein ligase TRIML1 [Trichosurus vulpecula]
MDVKDLVEKLQNCLTCSICLGYFTDPVTVKCGHTFCTRCLIQCSEEAQETFTCPECRGVIKYSRDMVTNKSLQTLSITAKMIRHHLLQTIMGLTTCDQHGEKEKFFCEEDHRTLCDSCSLAPEHQDHQVLPLEEAIAECKEKLWETRDILQGKEESFKLALDSVIVREARCKEDALTFRRLIESEYKKMHQFLWDEEILQMQKLYHQCRDNLVKFEENKANLSRQIQNLRQTIIEVEENLNKAPSEMIQDTKGTLERNENLLLQEPEVASFDWTTFPITGLREVLMCFHKDITLDPETANPHLILSEDLKSVKYGSVPQDLPDNKERFVYSPTVLGAQTFTSGKHYWEVEMRDKTEWEIGV